MSEGFNWYVLQTYSGHENKVKALIELKADEMGDDADIGDVVVPTQEVAEIRGGRRVTVTKRLYPGYVLVRLRLSQNTLSLIHISEPTRPY